MQCIKPNPITVKGERFHVPCGKCNFCLQNRRNEWAFRLHQQYKKSNSAEFLTLTYETENLPIVKEKWTNIPFMNLEKKHLITFHRSIRKANSRTLAKIKKRNRLTSKQYAALKHKWQIKYYSVGEYGTKHHRPHYHTIIFNVHPLTINKMVEGDIWKRGAFHRGDVNEASISYATKYLIDKDKNWENDPRVKPFSVMSKGLGLEYLKKNSKWHKQEGDNESEYRFYVMYQGYKMRMPRYYKDKIFTPEEKQKAGTEAIAKQNELINKEIAILEKTYGSEMAAYERYMERMKATHDAIRSKSIKLNSKTL